MSQRENAFHDPRSFRLIEHQGEPWETPRDGWLAGTIVELARLVIPLEVSGRLIQWEYEFRDPNHLTLHQPELFGVLPKGALSFYLCVNYNNAPLASPINDLAPWFVIVPAGVDSIRGWPGVPLPLVEGVNAYTRAVNNRRELPCAIPVSPGSRIFLIARFYQNISGEEYEQFAHAMLCGRLLAEISSNDTAYSDTRMRIGPR